MCWTKRPALPAFSRKTATTVVLQRGLGISRTIDASAQDSLLISRIYSPCCFLSLVSVPLVHP